MAGLMSRASMVVKAKFSKLLDHAENPAETLDYSYERQLELLQNVKRGIGEAATGIGEQMTDTGLAIQRAKDKTEQMQARASAIDELTTSGALEDFTSDQTQLDRELGALASKSQVDDELAKIKAEVGPGEKQKELQQ